MTRNRSKRASWTILHVAILAAFVGCGSSRRLGDFTVLSTHTLSIPIEKASQRSSGQTCLRSFLFGLIHVGNDYDYKLATDAALNPYPQYEALVDVVVRETALDVWIYSEHCLVFEGTLARFGSRSSF